MSKVQSAVCLNISAQLVKKFSTNMGPRGAEYPELLESVSHPRDPFAWIIQYLPEYEVIQHVRWPPFVGISFQENTYMECL